MNKNEPAGAPSSQGLLVELTDFLAVVATRAMYDEQPELWQLGEQARARTLEDFGHHFRALATLDEMVFTSHVEFCMDLFRQRSFPQQWLTDGWRHMAAVMERELPPKVAEEAGRVLRLGVADAGGEPPTAPATEPLADC
jgi:hypothetical protein